MEVVDVETQGLREKGGETSSQSTLHKKLFSTCRAWTLILFDRVAHFACIFFFLEVSQMMHFAFSISYHYHPHSDSEETLHYLLRHLFKILTVYEYALLAPASIIMAVSYTACALPFLTLCFCLLSLFKYLKKSCVSVVAFYLADYQSHVLFLPVLGTLLLTLKCSEDSQGWSAEIDNSVACFSVKHISIAIPAILAALCLLLVSTVFKGFVFDHRMGSANPLSKQTAVNELVFHFCRTVLCILLVALPWIDSLKVVYMLAYLGATVYVFWIYFSSCTYFNAPGESLSRVLHGISLWAGLCTLLPLLLSLDEHYIIFGFVFTLPMVVPLVGFASDSQRLALQARQVDSLKEPSACLGFCIELNRLANDSRRDSKEASFLLKAYVELQTQRGRTERGTRRQEGAAIKRNMQRFSQEDLQKSIMHILNRHAKTLSTRCPTSVALKIFYISFLLNDTRNYSLAWALTDQASQMESSATELFILFCTKKLLKDKADRKTSEKREEFNAIVVMRQSNIEKKFQELLERLVKLYSRFWYLLQDKYPSNELFEELGFGILKSKSQLDKMWEMMKVGGRVPTSIVALYSKFTEEVELDSAKSKLIVESLQTSNTISQSDFLLYYATNGAAILTVSAVSQSHGFIRHYNGAFSRITGYLRDELTNSPLENIMPSIFREAHKRGLLARSLQIEAGDLTQHYERDLFIVHKSQYIVPVTVKIVAIPNFLNGYVFIASLTVNKEWNNYNLVHLLLDGSRAIVGFSSNAQLHFGLNSGVISDGESVSSVIPEFGSLAEGTQYTEVAMQRVAGEEDARGVREVVRGFGCVWRSVLTRGGSRLGIHVVLNWLERSACREQQMRGNVECSGFSYSLTENKYFIDFHSQESGVEYKAGDLRRLQSKTPPARMESRVGPGVVKSESNVEDQQQRENLNGFYQMLIRRIEEASSRASEFAFLNVYRSRPDYALGINAYRLEDSRYIPLDNSKSPVFMKKEDVSFFTDDLSGTRKQNVDLGNDKIIRSTIKSKSYLAKLLLNLPLPPSFNRLIFITSLCMIIGIAIGITEYVILMDLFNNIYSELRLTFMQFDSIRCVAEASTWNMQAFAVNSQVQPLSNAHPLYPTTEELGNWTITRMADLTVEFNDGMIGRENIKQAQLLTEVYTVKMNYSYNETKTIALKVPFQMAYYLEMDTIYNLTNAKSFAEFTLANPHVEAMEYNFKNVLLKVADDVLNSFVATMDNLYTSQQLQSQIIVFSCVAAIGLLVLLQIPFIYSINLIIKKQASLFLSMPMNECRHQKKTADQFFEQFKGTDFDIGSLEEGESDRSHNSEQSRSQFGDERLLRISEQSGYLADKRYFSQSLLSKLDFIWRILLVLAISLGYILGVYFAGESHFNALVDIEKISNTTVRIDADFVITDNLQRTYFWDPTYKVKSGDSLRELETYHTIIYELTREIYRCSDDMLALFSNEEKTDMETFLYSDMCVGSYSASDCASLKSARKGYLSALVEFTNLEKNLFYQYRYNSNLRSYFQDKEFARSVDILYKVVRPGYTFMYTKVMEAVGKKNEEIADLIKPLLVLFVILNICIMVFMWMPYIQTKKAAMVKTRVLLSLIPIEVIINIKVFQNFFSGILFKHKK